MRNLSKQSFLGNNLDNVLRSKTICIIGLNGGGSHLIQQLANIGFQKYILCDPGKIDDDRKLNRNVLATLKHYENKSYKVDVAIERILSLNPNAEIIAIRDKWQIGAAQGKLNESSVIMGAVDRFDERDQIERFSKKLKIPYIDIGMDIKSLSNGKHYLYGQAVMTFPGGPCLRCLGFLNEEIFKHEAQNYGDAGDRPQVVWPNGILASTAVSYLTDYFFEWSGQNHPFLYRQYDGNKKTVIEHEHSLKLVRNLKKGCEHF